MKMEIIKALEELRKGKKRKFVQTLDLIVNLKDYDVRKEALNTFVGVTHGSEKKLAAFLIRGSPLIDTITEEDFKKYKEAKDIKKLAKKYDFFIAEAPLMGKIATHFGRVFGPMSKMPSPQAGIIPKADEDSLKAVIEKMTKVVRVKNKEKAIKIPVGNEGMSDEELKDNIEFVLKALEEKLPRKGDNVKEVLIKFTMTKPVIIRKARVSGKNVKNDEGVEE